MLKSYKEKMLGKHECGEEEIKENDPVVETPDSPHDARPLISGNDGASDPTEMTLPHGLDAQTLRMMQETNAALQARYERLECEYDEAEIIQDEDAMYQLQNQMDEVMQLMYEF